jgi:hypothetical protein
MSHSRCTFHGRDCRHTGYGDTDHSNNDSLLGDEALPLPYPWDCQSSIETLCGKHGGFSVEDCRRHDVEYRGSACAARDLAKKEQHSDVPRRMHHMSKAVGSIQILLTKQDINASYIQGESLLGF